MQTADLILWNDRYKKMRIVSAAAVNNMLSSVYV
jgi:hypothetical protein